MNVCQVALEKFADRVNATSSGGQANQTRSPPTALGTYIELLDRFGAITTQLSAAQADSR